MIFLRLTLIWYITFFDDCHLSPFDMVKYRENFSF
jgi:hypothetical protein